MMTIGNACWNSMGSLACSADGNAAAEVRVPLSVTVEWLVPLEGNLGRELDAVVGTGPAVLVLTLTPEDLGADEDVLQGLVQQVRRGIRTAVLFGVELAGAVGLRVLAVADGAAPLV